MTAPATSFLVSAVLSDDLLALNRAISIIRRRNLAVASVTLGPARRPGYNRLACLVSADAPTAERMANQLRKMVGVEEVVMVAELECTVREQLLARVKVSAAQLAGLLDAIALFDGVILDENPHELTVEATGSPAFLTSLLRVLEPFGILDVARGGALAVPRGGQPEAGAASRPPAATPRIATAVPA